MEEKSTAKMGDILTKDGGSRIEIVLEAGVEMLEISGSLIFNRAERSWVQKSFSLASPGGDDCCATFVFSTEAISRRKVIRVLEELTAEVGALTFPGDVTKDLGCVGISYWDLEEAMRLNHITLGDLENMCKTAYQIGLNPLPGIKSFLARSLLERVSVRYLCDDEKGSFMYEKVNKPALLVWITPSRNGDAKKVTMELCCENGYRYNHDDF